MSFSVFPVYESARVGGDLALIQTFLPFSSKHKNNLNIKSSEVCIKAKSPLVSLPFKGQVTERTMVKWKPLSMKSTRLHLMLFISF